MTTSLWIRSPLLPMLESGLHSTIPAGSGSNPGWTGVDYAHGLFGTSTHGSISELKLADLTASIGPASESIKLQVELMFQPEALVYPDYDGLSAASRSSISR
jgi:hypothetical protein